MSEFKFLTKWSFDAPIRQVWDLLHEPEKFPSWWPGFERAEVISGKSGEVGSITQYRVRGSLGLTFKFELKVESKRPPKYLLLRANGDFLGHGEWKLKANAEGTNVTYTWNVEIQRPFLRLLSHLPEVRGYMKNSHDRVMRAGYDNLERLLKGEL